MSRREDRSTKGRVAPPDDRPCRQPDAAMRTPPAQSQVGDSNAYTVAVVCGLLLLAVMAVFGQTARHDFVNFDDDDYVYANRHVTQGLTGKGIVWAFTESSHAGLWIPLTWLSLMTDATLLRTAEAPPDQAHMAALAGQMHLVNVALHAANALILCLVLRAMTASLWRSAMAAAVFAVHPLNVESVAWITERKDVLSGLFGLLALGAYNWYARRPSVVRYLSVAAALALGLTAKPILVTWPLVFLLLDYWPLRRQFRAGLALEKVPFLLLAAAAAVATFVANRSGGLLTSLQSAPISARVARAAVLYVAYLGKSFWPVNLAAMYPVTPVESYWPALGAGVLLFLLTAGTLWGARRGARWAAVGWFWYLGTLTPTIGLVQVGTQVMADRFLYLPQIGICVALVWGVGNLAVTWRDTRWPLAAVAAPALAALTVSAWQQTSYWRNSERLWTHTLACTSRNDIAHNNLARDLSDRAMLDEAIDHYRKALEINPDYVHVNNNLGTVLARRGQIDEAIVHYRKALEVNPNYAYAHYNLGLALARRGQVDEAIAHFRRALEILPDDMDAHYHLGLTLARRGQVDEAIAHFRKALDIMPDYAEAHYDLGIALANRGEVNEAVAQFRRALEVKPDYADAHYRLGLTLAHRGEIDEAMAHFRKALEIKPDHAEAHCNLGNALAVCGKRDEAIEHYHQALGLASARHDRALAEFIRARIAVLQPSIPVGKMP